MVARSMAPCRRTSSVRCSRISSHVRWTTRPIPVSPTNMWCASSVSMNRQVRESGSKPLSARLAQLVLAVAVGEVREHEEREPVGRPLVERAEDARLVAIPRSPLEQRLGLLPAVAAEVGVEEVDHRPEVPALLHVHLEQVAEVVERRARPAQLTLLLHRCGLGVSLRDDQPPERAPVLPRHVLPRRLAAVGAEADRPARARARPGRSPSGSRASARSRSAPTPARPRWSPCGGRRPAPGSPRDPCRSTTGGTAAATPPGRAGGAGSRGG